MLTRYLSFILFLGLLVQSSFAVDYYKVLELNSQATEKEITKAFRRLSLQYHPDKNPGDQEAAQKFIEINKAHEVLSNPELRRVYDLQGEDGLERQLRGEHQGHWENQRRGPSVKADVRVSLEELYVGGGREMNFQKNVICPGCRGTGAKDGKTTTCPSCGGKGFKLERVQMGIGFTMQMQTHCNQCGGSGKTHAETCPICRGKKVVPEKKELKIVIEKGMKDGQQIVFQRESEQHPDYTPGDVIITLRQEPHSRFKRVGNNLYYDCPITLKEALLGVQKTVRHLDHHYTEIATKEVVQPFFVKVIKDQGMPVHNEPDTFGDMHVKFKVDLPKKLTEEDKVLLNKIFALDNE